ncbi:Ig-like domain repeat protein [Nocardioides jishulii]|nr:Ig-like domain repeat protein [Nocardioides jishulii]
MPPTGVRTATASAGAALAVLAATATVLPAASASTPAPYGLEVSSPNTTTTVLSWDREPQAAKYTVQVDNDESFGSPEFNQVTTNVSAVPHTALKAGLNHWRVRSISASNVNSEWTTSTFNRPNPMVPSAVSPVDGATLAQPDEPPLLEWSEVPGAKSYTVEVDDAPDFIGSSRLTTSTTSVTPSAPLPLGAWFWRVTATDASGQVSVPSAPSAFTIAALPAPELVSPVNSPDEEVEDVVLDWAPVRGAKTYALQVATNDGFEAGDLITDLKGITGTSYSPPGGYDNDQYYWRVRAVDAAGSPSAWSESPNNFKRHWPDRPWPVAPVQPGFPAYPADFDTSAPSHKDHPFYGAYVKNHDPEDLPIATLTDRSPYLQWTPVQHASHYELQLSSTPAFVSTNTKTCSIAGTTFTPTNASFPKGGLDHGCQVKEGTRYYWRVRPMDRPFTVEGIYSPTQKFVWEPEWFTELKPAHNATISQPIFSWKSAVAADEYRIVVYDNTGSRVASGTTRANTWTPVGNEIDRTKGPFTWEITAFSADGTPSLIRNRSFDLTPTPAVDPGTDSLPPLTALSARESDSPTMRAPTMSWTPHPRASHYVVDFGHADLTSWLVPAGGESFGKETAYTTFTDTGTRIMTPGRYRWRVRAFSDDGQLVATSASNIATVAGFEEVTGQTIALDGAKLAAGGGCALPMDLVSNVSTCPEVPTTPVLSWEPQEGIAFYGVYVSYDQNFTNLTETNIPASLGTMYAYDMLTLADNTSGVPYYWHIRPCKAAGICAPDPVSSATGLAKHAFKKVSPRVETHPTDDVVSTSEVTFTWRDYHDTNQTHLVTRDGAPSWTATYRSDGPRNGPINPSDLSNQSAARYRVRIAKDPLFADVIETATVDQTTFTATGKLYPEGPVYWRVSALDTNGNELSSSETRTFTKTSPAVETISPRANASVLGTTPFRWSPQAYSGQYELEVSRNDALFSSTNRLFLTKVWTTAYTWTKPIPVSADPYYYRVRRIDSSGNQGAWSTPVPFRVVSDSVRLIGPGTGSLQLPNGPSFSWEPVRGAATYLFEVKDSSGKVIESRSTPATAYTLFGSLAAGRHTWSVTARSNDGATMAPPSSDVFTVDTSLVPGATPVVGYDTERPEVGSELSVAPLAWNRDGVTESYQWLRDGATIKGATTNKYLATTADYNRSITVRVTGSLPSYTSTAVTSQAVTIGAGGAVIATAPPTVTGKAAVGQKLGSTPGSWPAKAKLSYQWLRNGSPIAGATGKTYTVTMADVAKLISLRVTGTLPGMRDGTSTSSSVSVPKASSTTSMALSKTKVKRGAKVTLSGTVQVSGVTAPTGAVTVHRNGKTIKTIKLAVSKKGKVTFVLPKKWKKGKHKIQLRYKGTGQVAASRSKVIVLKIT